MCETLAGTVTQTVGVISIKCESADEGAHSGTH